MGVWGNHECTPGLRARVEVKEGQLPDESRKAAILSPQCPYGSCCTEHGMRRNN